jgi:hypothetical protein
VRNLRDAAVAYRTLVLEGPEGFGRTALLAGLARQGFVVRRAPALDHVDPVRPFRELLAGPGRLAADGGPLHELVYGPLRRGRSRVTWIQALDFAEAVAERDGALVHAVPPPAPAATEAHAARCAYARVLGTLADHVPVLTVPVTGVPAPGGRRLLVHAPARGHRTGVRSGE